MHFKDSLPPDAGEFAVIYHVSSSNNTFCKEGPVGVMHSGVHCCSLFGGGDDVYIELMKQPFYYTTPVGKAALSLNTSAAGFWVQPTTFQPSLE